MPFVQVIYFAVFSEALLCQQKINNKLLSIIIIIIMIIIIIIIIIILIILIKKWIVWVGTICFWKPERIVSVGTICYNSNDLLPDRNDLLCDRNDLLPDIIYFWRMRVELNMVDKKLEYSKARGNEKMQLGMGDILIATIHMPVEIKTLQLIKHWRRNLVPYAGQSITCYPQEVPSYTMYGRYAGTYQICTQSTLVCSC